MEDKKVWYPLVKYIHNKEFGGIFAVVAATDYGKIGWSLVHEQDEGLANHMKKDCTLAVKRAQGLLPNPMLTIVSKTYLDNMAHYSLILKRQEKKLFYLRQEIAKMLLRSYRYFGKNPKVIINYRQRIEDDIQ